MYWEHKIWNLTIKPLQWDTSAMYLILYEGNIILMEDIWENDLFSGKYLSASFISFSLCPFCYIWSLHVRNLSVFSYRRCSFKLAVWGICRGRPFTSVTANTLKSRYWKLWMMLKEKYLACTFVQRMRALGEITPLPKLVQEILHSNSCLFHFTISCNLIFYAENIKYKAIFSNTSRQKGTRKHRFKF